jgi:hypothetical protein
MPYMRLQRPMVQLGTGEGKLRSFANWGHHSTHWAFEMPFTCAGADTRSGWRDSRFWSRKNRKREGGVTLGQPGKGALPRHSASGYGMDPLETRRRRGKLKRRCRAGVVCTLDLLQQMVHTYLEKGVRIFFKSLVSLIPAPSSSRGIQRKWRQPREGHPLHTRDMPLQGLSINRVSMLYLKLL